MASLKMPVIPAAFFGIVLGLAGLGNDWRLAHQLWSLPAWIGEAVSILAVIVWLLLIVLYALKWVFARTAALAEAAHPVQCCFIGLAGVATMLAAGALLPYARPLSLALFSAGALFTILFAVWRTGGLWQGDRQDAMTTPVLYLPAVAGSFVTAALLGALGYPEWGQYVFGAGFFTWLAIESVLVHRFYTVALPSAMRPTLGVQLAPAPVGAVAYLSVTSGAPDVVAHAMIGYGILQALILLRLLPWIRQEPFAPSYWAFTFGATALAAAPMRLVAHGDAGPALILAPILFVAANLVVVLIAVATVRLLVTGRLPVGWQDITPKKSDMVGQG